MTRIIKKMWNYFQLLPVKQERQYEIYFRAKFKLQGKTDQVFGTSLYGILLSNMIHSLRVPGK